MLNSEFLNDAAAGLAQRLRNEAGDGPRRQVAMALHLALARQLAEREIERGVKLIDSLQTENGMSAEQALHQFCLVVLNLNEFIYLD